MKNTRGWGITRQPKITLPIFNKLFYEKRLPAKEVAKQLSCALSSIGNFRHRHHLPPRGCSTPYWKGKKRSPDTIEKMRQGMIGKLVGVKNPNWTGGRYINTWGYVMIKKPHHPMSSYGYVLEHRYFMSKKLGRMLRKNEVVHHLNGNKLDNRLSNLSIFTRPHHATHHFPKGSLFGINDPNYKKDLLSDPR